MIPLLRGARGVFFIGIACESQEKVISTKEFVFPRGVLGLPGISER